MLATLSHGDVSTLFLVLAVLAFAAGVYLCYLGNVAAGVAAAFIGVLILLFA